MAGLQRFLRFLLGLSLGLALIFAISETQASDRQLTTSSSKPPARGSHLGAQKRPKVAEPSKKKPSSTSKTTGSKTNVSTLPSSKPGYTPTASPSPASQQPFPFP